MKNYSDLARAIENSRQPNITEYISKGFNLTFKEPWLLIGFTVLSYAISFVVSFIPFVSLIATFLLQPVLVAGYNFFFHNLNTSQRTEFGDFFNGFRNKYGQIVLANFLVFVIAFVVILVLMVPVALLTVGASVLDMSSASPETLLATMGPMLFLLFVVIFVIAITLGSIFVYVMPIVCLTDVSATDAIKLSVKLALKNYLPTIGLLILCFLVMLGGVLALLFGILIAVPVVYGAIYYAVYDLVDLDEEDVEEDLTDHLLID